MMNRAFLMKVGWGLNASPTSLWSQALITKYGLDLSNLASCATDEIRFSLVAIDWRVWSDAIMGVPMEYRGGKKVMFWWDCWVTKDKPLVLHATSYIPENILCNISRGFRR